MTPVDKYRLSDQEVDTFSGCLRFIICAILAIILSIILSIVTFFLTGE